MANPLAAGEYPVALMSQVTKIEEMKEKGAPVDWASNTPNFSTVGAYTLSRNIEDAYRRPLSQNRDIAAGVSPKS